MNAQQAKDRNRRQGISDTVLSLLGRAQGLDILLYAEQDQVTRRVIALSDADGNVGEIINEGYTLSKIDMVGAHFERLEGINYPVPTCEASVIHRSHRGLGQFAMREMNAFALVHGNIGALPR